MTGKRILLNVLIGIIINLYGTYLSHGEFNWTYQLNFLVCITISILGAIDGQLYKSNNYNGINL